MPRAIYDFFFSGSDGAFSFYSDQTSIFLKYIMVAQRDLRMVGSRPLRVSPWSDHRASSRGRVMPLNPLLSIKWLVKSDPSGNPKP